MTRAEPQLEMRVDLKFINQDYVYPLQSKT